MAGRSAIEWTDREIEQFKKLCSRFNSEADICDIMGVTDKTLVRLINKHLKEEITPGSKAHIPFDVAREHFAAEGRSSLRSKLFEMAMDGNERALMMLAENELGYTRKKSVEKEKTKPDKGKKEASPIEKQADAISKLRNSPAGPSS